MKINLKIDPYNYPIILIAAFVVGFVLAIALGFRPQHEGREREGHGVTVPAMVLTVPAWDMVDGL